MTQTTSPLLPILASLDAARRQMALDGHRLLDQTLSVADEARRRLAAVPGLSLLDADRLGVADYDPTRLVIDVNGLGLTGFDVERRLRERFGVAPEMSDLSSIICLITLGDTPTTVDRLVDALTALAEERTRSWRDIPPMRSIGLAIAPGEQALAPREAYFAARARVRLAAAVGRVAAEFVVPYPPGIPVLAPGEIVSQEKIDYLIELACRDAYISGQSDRAASTILVVNGHIRNS
jgi:arginine/lysine/ornithine decarboxylase